MTAPKSVQPPKRTTPKSVQPSKFGSSISWNMLNMVIIKWPPANRSNPLKHTTPKSVQPPQIWFYYQLKYAQYGR